MSRKLKEKILELRNLGKSYGEIEQELNCSRGLISYHCGEGQKEKNKVRKINYKLKITSKIARKIEFFSINNNNGKAFNKNLSSLKAKLKWKIEGFSMSSGKSKIYVKPSFTADQLLDKIGGDPKCYLTGVKIDLENTKSWHLDHMTPRSKGGNNDIENANICTKEANLAKSDLSLEDFINLCKSVLEHNGYDVNKKVPID